MQISPLIVGYELEERRLVAILAWIDVGMIDSGNGVRLAMLPSTLLFSLSFN
jgi:hypothetical protein